jgi:multiple sugar transport system permease protein
MTGDTIPEAARLSRREATGTRPTGEETRRGRGPRADGSGFLFSPWHLVLIPLAVVMLVPMVWMLVTSLETLNETRHFPPVLLPHTLAPGNYTQVLQQVPFARWFANTLIVTVATVAGNLLLCAMAGYAFARIKFFGREVVFILVLATLMIPFQVVMIPTFIIVRHLGLINTLGGLIVPNLAQAFGIFLFRQFFRTLPVELEEAARIDGASRIGILFKIVLPLSGPVLATVTVITFLYTWNDFLWPLITIYSPSNMTLQLGLTTFEGTHQTITNLLMAANVMSLLPVLLLFFLAQRYFIRGIANTGLKG